MDKRDRLVRAAKHLFHEQGISQTSLADIARESVVPLGNVYYYFKTKDAVIEAVIAAHLEELTQSFTRWETAPTPRARLLVFLHEEAAASDMFARYGCPYGSLCQEMERGGSSNTSMAAALFSSQVRWLEAQFRDLGQGDRARACAIDVLSALQGAYLLALTWHTPDVLTERITRLAQWIESLAPPEGVHA